MQPKEIRIPQTVLSSTVGPYLSSTAQPIVLDNGLKVSQANFANLQEQARQITAIRPETKFLPLPEQLYPQIPRENVIPPEILLKPNTLQLADSVAIQGGGLSSTVSPPVSPVYGNVQSINIETKVNAVDPKLGPLLTETRPFLHGLAKYNIDPSQISLANIPLSEVQPLGLGGAGLLKGSPDISEAVWNRYGRQIKRRN